jgi:hypothetical protein
MIRADPFKFKIVVPLACPEGTKTDRSRRMRAELIMALACRFKYQWMSAARPRSFLRSLRSAQEHLFVHLDAALLRDLSEERRVHAPAG